MDIYIRGLHHVLSIRKDVLKCATMGPEAIFHRQGNCTQMLGPPAPES